MTLPTTTLLTLCQQVAKNIGAYRNGTATGGSTTTLVSATYPYKTTRTNASVRMFEGVEIRPSSGVESGNARTVDSYAPSTGTFTTGLAWGTGPSNADTFDMYLRGIEFNTIKDCVNKALRERRYVTVKPLSLLSDADMESSVTTAWSVSGAGTPVLSKVATAGNLARGALSLKATNSGVVDGYFYQTIRVIPGAVYTLQGLGRIASGGMKAYIYDATNSAYISGAYGIWDDRDFVRRKFSFTIPSTCYSIQVRFILTNATANEVYLDDAILLEGNATRLALPDSIASPGQVLSVCYDKYDANDYPASRSELVQFNRAVIEFDTSNPLGMYSVVLPPISGPVYVKLALPHSELTTDAATTTMKREWLEAAATTELLSIQKSKAPTQEVIQWSSQYEEWAKRTRWYDRAYMPMRQIFKDSTYLESPTPEF